MTRLDANRKLVEYLIDIIEQHPDLRFSQILSVFRFVRTTRPVRPNVTEVNWENEFYVEPEQILKRVFPNET